MVVFIILFFVGLLFSIMAMFDENLKFLIIAIICVIIFSICAFYVSRIPKDISWKEEWKTNIIALKDNSNIHGHIGGGIFVTSGYINESMYYYCMESTEQGKHMIKIEAEKSYIIETNDICPMIIKQKAYNLDKRLDFWLDSSSEYKYIIYVPEGTVDANYKVNLE